MTISYIGYILKTLNKGRGNYIMTKKYQVFVSDYSLNELANKLRLTIYGNKVIVSASDVVPAFSNLVESDPDTKGVTWELDYKGQADSLVNRLNKMLKKG